MICLAPLYPGLGLWPHGKEAVLGGLVQSVTWLDFALFVLLTDSPSE